MWHFQGLLSLQAQLLPLLVPTISLFKSWYFTTFSLSFSPSLTSAGTTISVIISFRYFLPIKIISGLLASIRLSHWMLISHNTLTSSFSAAPSGMYSYYFSVFSNPFFLQSSQWTFLTTLLCRLLYSLWANFSHLLTKFYTLSPVFPHNLHRGLSMWCFTYFVLMACSCAAHNSTSVTIFKSILNNHRQFIPLLTFCSISLINYPCIFFLCQFCLSSCACFF